MMVPVQPQAQASQSQEALALGRRCEHVSYTGQSRHQRVIGGLLRHPTNSYEQKRREMELRLGEMGVEAGGENQAHLCSWEAGQGGWRATSGSLGFPGTREAGC